MTSDRLAEALKEAHRLTEGRLKIYGKKMRGDPEAVAGRERHADSRHRRRWQEGCVAVNVYLPPLLNQKLEEACGDLRPGKKRVFRERSKAYMVELLLYRALVDSTADRIPEPDPHYEWSSDDINA